MSAITIPTNIPANLVVLSSELIERIDTLVLRAIDLEITDFNSTKPADQLHKEMRAMVKEIEAGRKSLTAPLDAIKAQAIEAERMGTAPLLGAVESLGKRIQTAIAEHNASLMRQRIEAENERRRLQAIEDAKAEARRQELIKQAEFDAPPGEDPAEISVIAELPKTVAPVWVPPPVKSSAVRNATDYQLEFISRDMVPAFSAAGHELRTIDEGALKKFLKGLPEGRQEIPGAVRLVKSNTIAAKG